MLPPQNSESESESEPEPESTLVLVDQYYGHEDTAKMCAWLISDLFSCPEIPPTGSQTAVAPTLAHFVAYTLHRTRFHSSVAICALYLLSHLETSAQLSFGLSGERLYISAFMIASKTMHDDSFDDEWWCEVAQQRFSPLELDQMERDIRACLQWDPSTELSHLHEFEDRVREEYSSGVLASPTSMATV